MPRRNFISKRASKNDQWSKAYVRIPEYPYIYVFKIKSLRVNCINVSAYYFATSVSDVHDNDHPLIDRLLAQL